MGAPKDRRREPSEAYIFAIISEIIRADQDSATSFIQDAFTYLFDLENGVRGPEGFGLGEGGVQGWLRDLTGTFNRTFGTNFDQNALGGVYAEWKKIAEPELNASKDAVKQKILATIDREMAGQSPKAIARAKNDILSIVKVESNFRPTARPIDPKTGERLSSAYGIGQFIKGTWQEVMPGVSLEARADVATSTVGLLKLRQQNINHLRSAGVHNPDVVDVYLAHFMGAGTAGQFLRRPDNAIAADCVSQRARLANDWVFYDKKTRRPYKVGEVKANFAKKLNVDWDIGAKSDPAPAAEAAAPAAESAAPAEAEAAATPSQPIKVDLGALGKPEPGGLAPTFADVLNAKDPIKVEVTFTPGVLDAKPAAGPHLNA
ncbi:MAG: hypothetical protein JKP92_02665 [Alphaproteobacteria bacterium]|nr:hypothetical protein [Alphaproteobacteria bacterium]